MSVAELISDMVRAGVSPELIGRTAELMCQRETCIVEVEKDTRSKAAIRQQRYRDNQNNERNNVTESVTKRNDVTENVTKRNAVTDDEIPLDKEIPPTPPKEINPPKEKPPYGGQKENPHVVSKSSKPAKRGTRLEPDWQLSGENIQDALDAKLDRQRIVSEADKFRDYWIGVSGARGVKRDWDATWRNWCRRAAESHPRGSPPHQQPSMNGSNQLISELRKFRNERYHQGEMQTGDFASPGTIDLTAESYKASFGN